MDGVQGPAVNVRQVVPLMNVSDMAQSMAFYEDGLGFRKTKSWTPDGALRWAWLELGDAALMIQQHWRDGGGTPAASPPAPGLALCLMCEDALAIWRAAKARGLTPDQPFVGNGLWVVSFRDPDGYRLDFESPTDAAEETVYEGD